MKKTLSYIFAATLILATSAAADPGIPDTVRIDSVSAMPGGTVKLPIYFTNDEYLGAVIVVLKHDSALMAVDSFSLKDGRVSFIPDTAVYFRDSGGLIDIPIYTWFDSIPPGSGLLCDLYFTVSPSAANQTIVIDSGFFPPVSRNLFVTADASSFEPQFEKGYVTVGELPPNSDSVWVDTVTTSPGHQIAVNVYGYNQENLTGINLALNYSSDDLIFNSVIFDNTRGASAYSRIVNSNLQNRQILISLTYIVSNPLVPGSGPLATILFDIPFATPDNIVTIDSASYLGIQRLDFSPAVGAPFGPYFRAGHVNIKGGTPVDDRPLVKIPTAYDLAQNYPNPFNPATIVKFDLPTAGHVNLEVFNILGQKVKTLIDRNLPAGTYNVTFDGRGDNKRPLASGIYLYRLKAGDFSRSRMMMLLK